jgi:MFS family permease
VAWQVYSITHRALDLGYTGLALFLPGLLFLLPAGHVADRFDRRRVILVCYALQAVCTVALLLLTRAGLHGVYPIYAVLLVIGTGRAFSGPASSALIPHLVPEKHFVNAVTWGGAIFQFANITGPALGGLLFTLPLLSWVPDTRLEGAGIVYVFNLSTLGWFLILVSTLHARPGRMEHQAASLKVILAGFQFVRRSPMLLGSFSLDLFVVLLGGAVALMPIFAHDILHQGPRGLGMLRAAPAIGALAMSLIMARFPFRRHAGPRLFICVAIFGAATVVFGLSHNLWLSLGALSVAGAADMISVIIRGSLLQLATPPEMRGRVSAVNSLFIGGSNELGEFESGLTAQWWGAKVATLMGGLGALAVAGLWAVLFPGLRRTDELSSAALRPQVASKLADPS